MDSTLYALFLGLSFAAVYAVTFGPRPWWRVAAVGLIGAAGMWWAGA